MNEKKRQNIYLIGPMGAGKTSIAKQLAKLTRHSVYDSDDEIVKRSGVEISWIFDQEGEAGFRKRETAIIVYLTSLSPIILSTGGGSILSAQNRKCLSENGMVIYLRVDINEQLRRTLRKHNKRPLLDCDNPKEKLLALNKKRESLYQEVADLSYQTDLFKPLDLAKKILKDIKNL